MLTDRHVKAFYRPYMHSDLSVFIIAILHPSNSQKPGHKYNQYKILKLIYKKLNLSNIPQAPKVIFLDRAYVAS